MWQTPMALSVAFFDDGGEFIDSADMAPCLEPPIADCQRYAPDEPFLAAIEVPFADLDDLGIAEGSRISLPGTAGGP
jgi:uncharacterized membrane protein (UPF0127 family)